MEVHQLRDFVTVAHTGSFSQAALKCCVAQPSLSKAVQRLEAEVGEKLLVRSKRRTVLTPAGEMRTCGGAQFQARRGQRRGLADYRSLSSSGCCSQVH
jgi:hypothetical protein